MMKVIVAIALILAVVSAQQFCVELTQDDTTCEGLRTNWPTKVCSRTDAPVSSATSCDLPNAVDSWIGLCPVKNVANSSFCDGTGYAFPYYNSSFCNAYWTACNATEDCNIVVPVTPTSEPVAVPPPFCFECCLFCFEEDACYTKLNDMFPQYTNSTTCTPCEPVLPPVDTPVAAPVADNGPVASEEPNSNVPSTTTQPTSPNTRPISRTPNSAASVAASATLIIATALLA